MSYVIPIIALAVLCGGWVVFQRFYAKRMPEAPGIERGCDGCPRDGTCWQRGECNVEQDFS